MRVEGIIFDFGRTLYDPTSQGLFPKTVETLSGLARRGLKLGLVSLAETDDTERTVQELADLGINQFFQAIDIIARSVKTKDFTKVLKSLGFEDKPESCMVVGDNLKKEIVSGNAIGAYTVQTRQRLLIDSGPMDESETPKATVNTIEELIPLVDNLNSLS